MLTSVIKECLSVVIIAGKTAVNSRFAAKNQTERVSRAADEGIEYGVIAK
jgi:hypothetical protein